MVISYPASNYSVSWATGQFSNSILLLYLSMCQFYTCCSIKILPIYRPTDEEKNDPGLFAENVRALMGKEGGMILSDGTIKDSKRVYKSWLKGILPTPKR